MDADLLTYLRANQELYMDRTASILRRTIALVDNEETISEVSQGTAKVRLMSVAIPVEGEAGGVARVVQRFVGKLPWNADIRTNDILVVDGIRYEVSGSDKGVSEPMDRTVQLVSVE